MSTITHVVIDGFLYDVQKPTPDTLKEFILEFPKGKIDEVLKNKRYASIKKVKPI
ncbi:MAG: hypothetical protein O8C66_04680 [Candidatus Methanoperedens sp.]|nr:hypothetical protein [Candidatus Methanoperedens sp.]MCZ7369783.1 hypothetical protein [Candidatus Methanoperedens sp.]